MTTEIETGGGVNTQAGQSALDRGALSQGYPRPYDYTSERKLQIFHSILTARLDMNPIEAATAAEAVFQKLCIPQAPSA